MHVHVICSDGEAKYWLEPEIELARDSKLSAVQLNEIRRMVEEHQDEIKSAWKKHFPG